MSLPVVDWVEKNIEEINAVLLCVLLVFISNTSLAITSDLLSKLHDKTINQARTKQGYVRGREMYLPASQLYIFRIVSRSIPAVLLGIRYSQLSKCCKSPPWIILLIAPVWTV